jgi:hypothetical protein
MRVSIVPSLPYSTGCSTEFAVLRSKCDLSEWELLLLLRSDVVQQQIQTLTSGTSSSHNRIKSRDLGAVNVPVPKPRSKGAKALRKNAEQLEAATIEYYKAVDAMGKAEVGVNSFFGANTKLE